MTEPGITALVAAHPARLRNGLLTRALNSICKQTLQPQEIIVVNDSEYQGAGWTRRTALSRVQTEWFAWLDSDDYWYPYHLEKLVAKQQETGAVYVFSWFDGRNDPLGHFGKTYNIREPHHTTITCLIRTDLAKEVGYRDGATKEEWPVSNEDLNFIFEFAALCVARDLQMVHLPEKTWFWEQGPQNSSGQPGKGDAI